MSAPPELVAEFQHLGGFHSLAIVNSASADICVQISLLYADFHSILFISRNDITVSYGSSIFKFYLFIF
jgi:hypothetical protein